MQGTRKCRKGYECAQGRSRQRTAEGETGGVVAHRSGGATAIWRYHSGGFHGLRGRRVPRMLRVVRGREPEGAGGTSRWCTALWIAGRVRPVDLSVPVEPGGICQQEKSKTISPSSEDPRMGVPSTSCWGLKIHFRFSTGIGGTALT